MSASALFTGALPSRRSILFQHVSIQATGLQWNYVRMGGKWIIYVGIHNSYLRNTGTVGIMQPGSISKRCYYFILGCRSPLSFPFILPWNLFRYAIDHSRGAKKVLRDVCACGANTLKCVIRQGHSANIIAINHAARPAFPLQWQGWAYFYALLYLSSVLFMH